MYIYPNVRFLYNFFYFLCISPQVTVQWFNWASVIRYFFGNLYFYTPKTRGQYHPFHILAASPWPLLVAVAVLSVVNGIIDLISVTEKWWISLLLGLVSLCVVVCAWWVDVINESMVEHTHAIKVGIGFGMILFIVSEVMFFFSFFWAFFHLSLAPGIEIGCVWPPKGLEDLVISPFGAPLLNTIILVVSGITVTCAHHAFLLYSSYQCRMFNFLSLLGEFIISESALRTYRVFYRTNRTLRSRFKRPIMSYFVQRSINTFGFIKDRLYFKLLNPIIGFSGVWGYFVIYFSFTLILAILFTVSQGMEYVTSVITISDSVYGSTFFVMTGFHGFHVLVGTVFLAVCFGRILRHRVSFVKTIGLECAVWYWHFVDVVWLFLFIFVYIWGNGIIPVIGLESVVNADFAVAWQLSFQDGASVLMELIVDLHNYIMFYLLVILGLVVWLLFAFTVLNPNTDGARRLLLTRFLALVAREQERVKRRLFFYL